MRDQEEVEEEGRGEKVRRKKWKFHEDGNLLVLFTPVVSRA